MPHPKHSLEQEERALANSYAEHSRRLNRSQAIAQQINATHPHFRHDLAPDVVETPLPAPLFPRRLTATDGFSAECYFSPLPDTAEAVLVPFHSTHRLEIADSYSRWATTSIGNTFRTRRRVTPR